MKHNEKSVIEFVIRSRYSGLHLFTFEKEKIVKNIITSTCLSLALICGSVMAQPVAHPSSSFTPEQIKQLDTIIHDYIVKNPEVLVEASQTLQMQQQKKLQTEAMSSIHENKAALFDNAQSPSIGSKTASVTLVEFFDYQCGHCRAMAPTIEKLISEDKNVHVIFKELPIFGGVSDMAAKAALAAAKQPGNKYYAFHNMLLTSTTSLSKESIMDIAKKAGLNVDTLNKDMSSPDIQKQLHDNVELAQALKIMGTPTFVISNKEQTKFEYIPGAVSAEELKAEMKKV